MTGSKLEIPPEEKRPSKSITRESADLVEQFAAHKPLLVMFRDKGLARNSVKIKFEPLFKLLSPVRTTKLS